MELKKRLMSEARSKGICLDGYREMKHDSLDGLINYYLMHVDWCVRRDFPVQRTLAQDFSDCEDKGVFIGRTFNGEVFDRLQTYVFHGCVGTISVAMDYDNAVIPMLYFANGCDITVKCEQKNKPVITVPLYIAEDCKVVGAKTDNCTFKRHTIKLIKP